MIAAIIGSRGFDNYVGLRRTLAQYPITRIVSGGAKGADTLGAEWSCERGLPEPIIFLPDWAKHGRAAGYIRNQDIVDTADFVVAFWDGKSRGTLSALRNAKKVGKPAHVWLYDVETLEIVRLLEAVEVC